MQGLATDFLDFRVGSVFLSCLSYVSWLRQIIFLHVRERLQFKLGVERNLLYWIVAEVTTALVRDRVLRLLAYSASTTIVP